MKKVCKTILTILKRFVTKNIGYKIIAIVFAFVLWLVVVNIQNPASTRTFSNIPVEIINEESVLDGDHIYTIRSGKTATITVAGTRSVLGNIAASDFEAVADFSALSLTNAAPITVSLTSEKARYENQIDITQRTTSMVIDIEELVTQEFPVEIHYYGTKSDDLVIDKVERAPETLTVSAPQAVAETISSVGIMVHYDDIKANDPMEFVPKIYDDNGNEVAITDAITLSSDTVTAQFITYSTKTVPILLEPFGTPAEGYELGDVSYSRSEISLKGPEELLAEVESIELPGTLLNISNRTSNVMTTIDLTEYLPEGISIADPETANVYVVVTANINRIEEETTTRKEEKQTETAADSTEAEE